LRSTELSDSSHAYLPKISSEIVDAFTALFIIDSWLLVRFTNMFEAAMPVFVDAFYVCAATFIACTVLHARSMEVTLHVQV